MFFVNRIQKLNFLLSLNLDESLLLLSFNQIFIIENVFFGLIEIPLIQSKSLLSFKIFSPISK